MNLFIVPNIKAYNTGTFITNSVVKAKEIRRFKI